MNQNHLIHNIRGLLQYHQSLGVEYERTEELVQFLEKDFSQLLPSTQTVSIPEPVKTKKQVITPAVKTLQKSPTQPAEADPSGNTIKESLADLEQELCQGCALKAKRLHLVEGKGRDRTRLMVVGDWLRESATGGSKKTVFGIEQDMMLARMFSRMQLPEEDVYITNVVRCALPDDIEVSREDVSRCVKYLYHQMERLQPELVCLMGSVAARTLLGKKKSLSQLRGKFYHLEISNTFTVPALATYHPAYLLDNKEMRWPAWEDLKKIAGRLGITISD